MCRRHPKRNKKWSAALQYGRTPRQPKTATVSIPPGRACYLCFSRSLSLSLSLSLFLSLSRSLLSTALVSKRFAQAPSPTHSISFRSGRIIRQPASQTALAAQTANHKNGCYCTLVVRDKNRIKVSLCVLLPFSSFALVRTPPPPKYTDIAVTDIYKLGLVLSVCCPVAIAMSPPTPPPLLQQLLLLLPLLLLVVSSGWLIGPVDGMPILGDTATSRSFVIVGPTSLSRNFSFIRPPHSQPQAPAQTQFPGRPPIKTLSFTTRIHLPCNRTATAPATAITITTTTSTTITTITATSAASTTITASNSTATGATNTTKTASKSKTFYELVPAPPPPATVTVTETVRETASETAKEMVTVTATVPARLGALEFPQSGYHRTVVLKMLQLRPTLAPSDGQNDSNSNSNSNSDGGAPVYGDAGQLVGYIPPAPSGVRAGG